MPTYRLPTTGYVVLHTVERDGEAPIVVTVFIDATGVLDDTTATEHVSADLTRLREAPANVTHTLRLVHRSDDGDRDVHTAGPVRGNGPPLA